jgi:hypothetical protein
MSDYLVCFGCHQRFIIAAMDRWIDHHFRCGAGSDGAFSLDRRGAASDRQDPSRLPEISQPAERLID